MSWTTGTHILPSHQSFGKLIPFVLFFQFALHEATFFLVRLLQQFTGFVLEKSENVQPPAEWATCDGLQRTEKVYPATHLTMYVKVSFFLNFPIFGIRMTFFV